jgi:hypothetical protein
MRRILAGLLLCLCAPAHAEELCGGGWGKSGRMEAQVLVSREGAAPARVTYVYIGVPNADESYRLVVHYDPTDAGLGIPTMARVHAYMPVPDPEAAEPEKIEWRAGADPWFNPGYWGTPRRMASDSKETRGSVDYTIAQGRVHPYRTELLEKFDPGVRWEFRRLDKNGGVIGSGAVDYPASPVIARLYEEARRNAVARLGPCRTGPPITASPAPPPPMRIGPPAPVRPAAPMDPAALDARVCALFRRDEKRIAETKPQSGRRTKLIEQSVDCTGRSVKQVYEMDSFQKGDRRDFRVHLQSMSDKMWCSSALFRAMVGRGWTFRMEFKEVGDPSVIGATTRKCR